ncbi:Hypothetical predicted protein, partial [Paramuricea clavata]
MQIQKPPYTAVGEYKKVIMNNNMTLQDLHEAFVTVFFDERTDLEDVLKLYNIAVVDGKSTVNSDKEINKHYTFGFYWKRK